MYTTIDSLFNALFHATYGECEDTTINDVSKAVREVMVTSPIAFDAIVDDTSCTIRFGMAGVEKENINITKKGNKFLILVKGADSDIPEGARYICKGLKLPSHNDTSSIIELPSVFDQEKVDVDYTNGRLSIKFFLKKEEVAKEIKF